MNRNEQEMYFNISSIAKSLDRIANALESNNKVNEGPFATASDGKIYYKTRKDMYMDNPCTKEEYEAEHGHSDLPCPDLDLRETARMYTEELAAGNFRTKKDCILDYITNEFGLFGARYTDIIKFCYYLGAPNAPKYTSANRGYYSCAFATRFGGHLVQGGKDQLVKGINCDGKERYYALSYVDNATDYYKRIS